MRAVPERLMTMAEVTQLVSLSETMVRTLVQARRFPSPFLVSRRPRWRRAEVKAWMKQREQHRKTAT
jgi:excisionase family DNA binding protein